ncbi:centromere protein H-like [Acanthaster planci]|uniref:Centromere protein H-like n=1 Tax=Acanthaster planci TaxID=133434 RepID=A0A8B7Y311_ACAPL|nr:centromere protein H-like [Acanthaster planci]
MADTTHNEVFDRLSQSFKESSLGQTSSVAGQSLLSTSQAAGSQPGGKPDQKLLQYIRYKEWLDTVKRDHEAAFEARRVVSSAKDQEQLDERILKFQKELLKESTVHSLKELALRRLQLSDTLLQILFPTSPSGSAASQQRDKFRDLTSKQSELVSEVIGHHKVCQRVQDELDSVQKECVDLKKRNRDIMAELLQTNKEKNQQASNYDNEKHRQVQGEIQRTMSHIQIGRNILQGLILGSGVNWAEDGHLKELMLSLGRPVEL